MKNFCFFLLSFLSVSLIAQPTIAWQKNYGGSAHEYAWKSIPTSDGGFVFTGNTESSNGDVPDNAGNTDLWVARVNSVGAIVWSFTYGGTEDEEGYDIVEAADGTFYVAGWTNSYDGDVTGNHGTYSSDFWVLHISSSGILLKEKCFGGTSDDDAAAIGFTPDGYLLVSGTVYSNDGDVSGNHSSSETDLWVIKLDTALNLLSQLCVGGSDYEEGLNMAVICWWRKFHQLSWLNGLNVLVVPKRKREIRSFNCTMEVMPHLATHLHTTMAMLPVIMVRRGWTIFGC